MSQRRLGIDFGHTGIKVTEASVDKDVTTIHWQGVVPVRSGAIASGILTDEFLDTLGADLKTLLAENKIKTKAAIAGVNAVGNVFAARTSIEYHHPKDIRHHIGNMVRHDAKIMGVQLEDVVIDLAVLDETMTDSDRHLDLFVCAVRGGALDRINKVIAKAGLRLMGVDINALASLRVLKTFPRGMGQVDVTVDIGADVTSVLIHENGKPVHLQLHTGVAGRDADMKIAEAMQEEDVTSVLAHKVRKDRDFRANAGLENYYSTLRGLIDSEITRYLQSRRTAEGVSGITIIGAGALIPGLRESISRAIDVPVVVGQLDENLAGDVQQYEKGQLVSVDYTASIGLATGGII